MSGLPSWGNVDSRSNMWSRVVTSDEGSMGPGQRFLHTMVADSDSSAILFGGVMPQVANQPAFNYEVKTDDPLIPFAHCAFHRQTSAPIDPTFQSIIFTQRRRCHMIIPRRYGA